MAWCLIKEYAEKFKKALISGDISPTKLLEMSSAERRTYLAQFVGDFNAQNVNILFESKLLLKNQQRGLITWAEKVAGLSETVRNDIVAKIKKLDKALNPETEKQFLADIVEARLGIKISLQEAKTITEMTQKIQQLYDPKLEDWQQSKEYWQDKQKLLKFLRDATEVKPTTRGAIARKFISTFLSVERAIKTGFDLSLALRQARTYFGTKEWMGAFRRMFSYAKDPLAMDELEIKIMTNKYSEYALQFKRQLGLTLLGEKFTQREEQFGAKIIEKIPALGASERAFVGMANDLRFNRFVNILGNLDRAGRGITDNPQAMKDLAEVIGASTGRGTLGSAEGAARSLTTVLFSPRWVVSRIEMLLNPLTKSGPARIEAARSLAMLAGTSVAILGMAKMAGADVEVDPRSSDFGKIKIGNTRFDVTGGLAPYITLLSRIATFSSKSSTTGLVTMLNSSAYGAQNVIDTIENFITSKTSPVASVVRDILRGETFGGEKLEIDFTDMKKNKDLALYLANQLFAPLLTTDAYQAFTDASGGALVGFEATAASLFGIGVNTYAPSIKQQIRDAYHEGDDARANQLLNQAKSDGTISENAATRLINDADLPNDILYFRDLSDTDQEKLLKKMDIADLQRFAWYTNEKIKGHISTFSENAKLFVQMFKEGKLKEPQWKRGKLINQ